MFGCCLFPGLIGFPLDMLRLGLLAYTKACANTFPEFSVLVATAHYPKKGLHFINIWLPFGQTGLSDVRSFDLTNHQFMTPEVQYLNYFAF